MFLTFVERRSEGLNRITLARVTGQEPAIALDGAVAHFKGLEMAGERKFEYGLFMKPPRELCAGAHLEVVIELAVCDLVYTAGHERMKLDGPFCLGVVAEVGQFRARIAAQGTHENPLGGGINSPAVASIRAHKSVSCQGRRGACRRGAWL